MFGRADHATIFPGSPIVIGNKTESCYHTFNQLWNFMINDLTIQEGAKSCYNMFYGCYNLRLNTLTLPLHCNVRDMFSFCENGHFYNINIQNNGSYSGLFANCFNCNLTTDATNSLNNHQNVDYSYLFYNCNLNYKPLSNINGNFAYMYANCNFLSAASPDMRALYNITGNVGYIFAGSRPNESYMYSNDFITNAFPGNKSYLYAGVQSAGGLRDLTMDIPYAFADTSFYYTGYTFCSMNNCHGNFCNAYQNSKLGNVNVYNCSGDLSGLFDSSIFNGGSENINIIDISGNTQFLFHNADIQNVNYFSISGVVSDLSNAFADARINYVNRGFGIAGSPSNSSHMFYNCYINVPLTTYSFAQGTLNSSYMYYNARVSAKNFSVMFYNNSDMSYFLYNCTPISDPSKKLCVFLNLNAKVETNNANLYYAFSGQNMYLRNNCTFYNSNLNNMLSNGEAYYYVYGSLNFLNCDLNHTFYNTSFLHAYGYMNFHIKANAADCSYMFYNSSINKTTVPVNLFMYDIDNKITDHMIGFSSSVSGIRVYSANCDKAKTCFAPDIYPDLTWETDGTNYWNTLYNIYLYYNETYL